jgi:hypothetical protein
MAKVIRKAYVAKNCVTVILPEPAVKVDARVAPKSERISHPECLEWPKPAEVYVVYSEAIPQPDAPEGARGRGHWQKVWVWQHGPVYSWHVERCCPPDWWDDGYRVYSAEVDGRWQWLPSR